MKRFVMVVVVGALTFGAWGTLTSDPVANAGGAAGRSLDDRATTLREDLGRFCESFDFYFKHSFGSGEMRPVRCSRRGREKTVVVAYVFSNRDTKSAWVNEWGTLAEQRGEPVFKGRRWIVEVLQPRWAQEVKAELND